MRPSENGGITDQETVKIANDLEIGGLLKKALHITNVQGVDVGQGRLIEGKNAGKIIGEGVSYCHDH